MSLFDFLWNYTSIVCVWGGIVFSSGQQIETAELEHSKCVSWNYLF